MVFVLFDSVISVGVQALTRRWSVCSKPHCISSCPSPPLLVRIFASSFYFVLLLNRLCLCTGIDTTGEVQQLLDKGATLEGAGAGGKKGKGKQRAVKAALPQLGLSNKVWFGSVLVDRSWFDSV